MLRKTSFPVAVMAVFALVSALRAADAPAFPDGLKGFHGTLSGKVVSVQEDGRGFVLAVTESKPDDQSKATDAKSAVGKELLINVQWEKGEGNQWHPVEAQVKFVKSLEKDKQVSLTVVNDELTRLHIVKLPE